RDGAVGATHEQPGRAVEAALVAPLDLAQEKGGGVAAALAFEVRGEAAESGRVEAALERGAPRLWTRGVPFVRALCKGLPQLDAREGLAGQRLVQHFVGAAVLSVRGEELDAQEEPRLAVERVRPVEHGLGFVDAVGL